MNRHLIAAALIFTATSCLFAEDKDEDTSVSIDKLPAKVTAEAQRVAGKVEIEKAQRKEKDGYVYYKIEATSKRRSYKFEITEQGETLKYDVKYEKEKQDLEIEQLPDAIRAAALKAVKGIELKDAKRETRGPVVTYEVDGKVDGRPFEITLTPQGKVIEIIDKDEEKARKEAEKREKEIAERKASNERN